VKASQIKRFTEFQTQARDFVEIVRACAEEIEADADNLNPAIKDHAKTLRKSAQKLRATANQVEKKLEKHYKCRICGQLSCTCVGYTG
jgi:F0F1-type ATP synthase membrane subunit b/b'